VFFKKTQLTKSGIHQEKRGSRSGSQLAVLPSQMTTQGRGHSEAAASPSGTWDTVTAKASLLRRTGPPMASTREKIQQKSRIISTQAFG
jgi:hypothetical protein